jgi:alkylation response protein AidB-like acyl-CoA dehydrogenase
VNRVLDELLQLYGGYGYEPYAIARMYADARVHHLRRHQRDHEG